VSFNVSQKRRKQVRRFQNPTDNTGYVFLSYILFPNNKIDGKHTINQARGVNSLIDDRFDLTFPQIKISYNREPIIIWKPS
jgi:hypothetical protein